MQQAGEADFELYKYRLVLLKNVAVCVFRIMFGSVHFFQTLCLLYASSTKCLWPLLKLDEYHSMMK